jgi:hypothetical protein
MTAPTVDDARAAASRQAPTEAEQELLGLYVQAVECRLGGAAPLMLAAVISVDLEIEDEQADALVSRLSLRAHLARGDQP